MVTTGPIIEPRSSNGVHFVKENYAGLFGPSHLKDLSHHSRTFSHVFLDQFRSYDSDEAGVSSVSHGSGSQCFSCAWRAVEQHSLWRIDSQINELFRSEQRHFHDFSELLQLLFAASNVVVGDIRFVLNRHHSDCCVYLGRQRHLNLVLLAVHSHSHSLLDISWRQLITEFHYKLGNLLEVNDVLALSSVVDYFIASGDLQRLLSGPFGVFCKIPLGGQRDASIEFLDAGEFVDLLHHFLVFLLQFLDGLGVGPKSISLEEINLGLVQRNVLLILLLVSHLKYFQIRNI